MSTETMTRTPLLVDEREGWTSASNAEADELCPGRHEAQKGIPEPERSEDALSGDLVHAALMNREPYGLSLTERDMYDSCVKIEDAFVSEFFGTNQPTTFREKRLWLTFPNGQRHSGRVDVLHRVGTKAVIIDYKTGRNEVAESPRNKQLRDLVVLARHQFIVLDEVAVLVIQPLVTHKPEPCWYMGEDIIKAERALAARVALSNQPGSPRFAGETQCAFCLAKRQCETYQKWAGQLTPPAMLSLLDVPMQSWTPDQLSHALTHLSSAEKFLKDLKAYGKEQIAKDPSLCPGFRLKPGRVTETVTDPVTVHTRFCAIGGTTDAFMKALRVTKTDLKEAIHETTGARGMALDNALDSMLKGCTESKTAEPTLEKIKD